jgi:HSP20 family protein
MDLKSLVPWRNSSKSNLPSTREDYFDPFVTFRREMDRMFDDFFTGFGGGRSLQASGGWPAVTPVVDVTETDKEIVVAAELPGLDEKDFEVTLAGDLLTIKGEKKSEHEQKDGDAHYVERRYGSFARTVRLPFEVGNEKVDAKYDKGVLTVRVPKPADAQKAARRIEVKTG